MTIPLWQRGARPEELAAVAEIDDLMRRHTDFIKKIARERARITSRALKRGQYVPVKQRKSPLETLREFIKNKAAE